MPHRAVEDAALTIALDPNHSVVPIRAHVPLAQIRFLRIDADQNVQLLARVRSRGKKMIKLICLDKAFPSKPRSKRTVGKLPGQGAVRIVDL